MFFLYISIPYTDTVHTLYDILLLTILFYSLFQENSFSQDTGTQRMSLPSRAWFLLAMDLQSTWAIMMNLRTCWQTWIWWSLKHYTRETRQIRILINDTHEKLNLTQAWAKPFFWCKHSYVSKKCKNFTWTNNYWYLLAFFFFYGYS